MQYTVHQEEEFKYIDEGQGQPLIILHGLLGTVCNLDSVIESLKDMSSFMDKVLAKKTI